MRFEVLACAKWGIIGWCCGSLGLDSIFVKLSFCQCHCRSVQQSCQKGPCFSVTGLGVVTYDFLRCLCLGCIDVATWAVWFWFIGKFILLSPTWRCSSKLDLSEWPKTMEGRGNGACVAFEQGLSSMQRGDVAESTWCHAEGQKVSWQVIYSFNYLLFNWSAQAFSKHTLRKPRTHFKSVS